MSELDPSAEPITVVHGEDVDTVFALVDENGRAVNVVLADRETAAAIAGTHPDVAGVRDVTHSSPRPGPGWTYDRSTKEWTE